jgi:hypothetical protein
MPAQAGDKACGAEVNCQEGLVILPVNCCRLLSATTAGVNRHQPETKMVQNGSFRPPVERLNEEREPIREVHQPERSEQPETQKPVRPHLKKFQAAAND